MPVMALSMRSSFLGGAVAEWAFGSETGSFGAKTFSNDKAYQV
jgi:hypothetical protein